MEDRRKSFRLKRENCNGDNPIRVAAGIDKKTATTVDRKNGRSVDCFGQDHSSVTVLIDSEMGLNDFMVTYGSTVEKHERRVREREQKRRMQEKKDKLRLQNRAKLYDRPDFVVSDIKTDTVYPQRRLNPDEQAARNIDAKIDDRNRRPSAEQKARQRPFPPAATTGHENQIIDRCNHWNNNNCAINRRRNFNIGYYPPNEQLERNRPGSRCPHNKPPMAKCQPPPQMHAAGACRAVRQCGLLAEQRHCLKTKKQPSRCNNNGGMCQKNHLTNHHRLPNNINNIHGPFLKRFP